MISLDGGLVRPTLGLGIQRSGSRSIQFRVQRLASNARKKTWDLNDYVDRDEEGILWGDVSGIKYIFRRPFEISSTRDLGLTS